ncbi:MAG: phage resistance protein, partial [Actinomycetota bacterium]|nr:phage resistance protein [Actinomycetota bacterium]
MSTLLSDLIEIPAQVNKGDFVMSLRDGVSDPAATLRDYVVTEQLVRAYDNALGFVASAVNEGRSKAAYLDGSFGSGKSHFMAVLHLLLQRDPQARAQPDLAATIAKHEPALGQRSFDLVPVHMIGAETMEQRVFDGYLAHLERVDPGGSPPALFLDGPIFAQAEQFRTAQGDEQFFATLNTAAGAQADEGWGELGAAWAAGSYATAAAEPVGGAQRARLVGDLIATHLPVMREVYRGGQGGWVDFDLGLAEIARHAAARGHDALVFFLDELILWLGSRMADPSWVAREGQKLIKFIEFSNERAIPIIAFVARQRDLREFVDESALGAEAASFADALKHWNDRFHRVELHDRNLPRIAARRLLTPRDEAARQQLDAAFAEVQRSRPDVLAVLLTATSDPESFRLTYPFSPAFMEALVAASSALQRERTALRVMLQLLVDRREDLMVGDLVSVGDLFDILKQGDEPFADDLRRAFGQARD